MSDEADAGDDTGNFEGGDEIGSASTGKKERKRATKSSKKSALKKKQSSKKSKASDPRDPRDVVEDDGGGLIEGEVEATDEFEQKDSDDAPHDADAGQPIGDAEPAVTQRDDHSADIDADAGSPTQPLSPTNKQGTARSGFERKAASQLPFGAEAKDDQDGGWEGGWEAANPDPLAADVGSARGSARPQPQLLGDAAPPPMQAFAAQTPLVPGKQDPKVMSAFKRMQLRMERIKKGAVVVDTSPPNSDEPKMQGQPIPSEPKDFPYPITLDIRVQPGVDPFDDGKPKLLYAWGAPATLPNGQPGIFGDGDDLWTCADPSGSYSIEKAAVDIAYIMGIGAGFATMLVVVIIIAMYFGSNSGSLLSRMSGSMFSAFYDCFVFIFIMVLPWCTVKFMCPSAQTSWLSIGVLLGFYGLICVTNIGFWLAGAFNDTSLINYVSWRSLTNGIWYCCTIVAASFFVRASCIQTGSAGGTVAEIKAMAALALPQIWTPAFFYVVFDAGLAWWSGSNLQLFIAAAVGPALTGTMVAAGRLLAYSLSGVHPRGAWAPSFALHLTGTVVIRLVIAAGADTLYTVLFSAIVSIVACASRVLAAQREALLLAAAAGQFGFGPEGAAFIIPPDPSIEFKRRMRAAAEAVHVDFIAECLAIGFAYGATWLTTYVCNSSNAVADQGVKFAVAVAFEIAMSCVACLVVEMKFGLPVKASFMQGIWARLLFFVIAALAFALLGFPSSLYVVAKVMGAGHGGHLKCTALGFNSTGG